MKAVWSGWLSKTSFVQRAFDRHRQFHLNINGKKIDGNKSFMLSCMCVADHGGLAVCAIMMAYYLETAKTHVSFFNKQLLFEPRFFKKLDIGAYGEYGKFPTRPENRYGEIGTGVLIWTIHQCIKRYMIGSPWCSFAEPPADYFGNGLWNFLKYA